MTPLFVLGPFQVTPYGLTIFAGALAGVLLTLPKRRALPALPLTILLALLGGHAFWCVFNTEYLTQPLLLSFLMPWQGGYTLYGAILGGLLGAFLSARLMRAKAAEALDALAPGAAAAIFFGRLGEYFTGQGAGSVVMEEELCFFPYAFVSYEMEDYVEWSQAVWCWEAAAALVILAVLLLRRRRSLPGQQTVVFLGLLGTSQIFLEQLRCDDFVRITTFIRFSQIAAMATLIGALTCLLIRHRAPWQTWALSFGTLAAATLGVIFTEFVFDKPQYNLWLHLSTLLAVLLAALLLLALRGQEGRMAAGLQGFMGCMLLLVHILGRFEDDAALLFCLMAFHLAVMGIVLAVNLRERAPAAGDA